MAAEEPRVNAAERAEKLAELSSIREGALAAGASAARALELLDDDDEDVRAEAALAAGAYTGDAAVIARILDVAAADPSPAVRSGALRALGHVVLEGDLLGCEV